MKVTMIRIANEVSDYSMTLFGNLPSLGDFIHDILEVYEKVFSKSKYDLQTVFDEIFLFDE